MEKQDEVLSGVPQKAPSREELEMHLRARAWKDDAFRQEFLTNPRAVLQRDYAQYFPEGQIPSELSIKVIEEEEQALCFVLPPRLSDDLLSHSEGLNDEELLALSGGTVFSQYCPTSEFSTCGPRCKGKNITGILGKLRL
jgi:hypothetical protein